MDNKQKLAYSIIKHLKSESAGGEHSEDISESLEVAIECLEQCYKINTENSSELDCGKTLMEIFKQGMQASDSDKAKAEDLKVEGNDLMKAGKYDDAIASYTKAISADGNNAVYYSNRAAAYTKVGSNEKAISDCKEAIKIDPNFTKAHGRLGLVYLSMQDYASAKVSYEKALSLDPSNAGYQVNLDLIKEKLKEKQDSTPQQRAPPARMPNLGGMDIGSLLSNPAVMNMAQSFLQNPQLQNMFSNLVQGAPPRQPPAEQATTPQETQPAGGLGNLDMDQVFGASREFAQNLQRDNPELVDQLKNTFDSGLNQAKKDEDK